MNLQNNKKKNHKAAFNLLELLIVITIIVILATLGTMVYTNIKNKAQRKNALAFFVLVKAGLANYYADFGDYPTPAKNKGTEYGDEVDGAFTLYQALTGDGWDKIYYQNDYKPTLSADARNSSKTSIGEISRFSKSYLSGFKKEYNDGKNYLKHQSGLMLQPYAGQKPLYCFVDPYHDSKSLESGLLFYKAGKGDPPANNPETYDLWMQMGKSGSYPKANKNWLKNW